MNDKYEAVISAFGQDRVKVGVNLADYTTYQIGGPADLLFEAAEEEELIKIVSLAEQLKIDYIILGGGSNVLISDQGFLGLVILCRLDKVEISPLENNQVKIYAQAGVMIWNLMKITEENSLGGLEFLAGIPGSVGGAVRGNAGAWQKSTSDYLTRVKILSNEKINWIEKNNCSFSYRESRFKHNKEIILGAEFILPVIEKTIIKKNIEENLKKRENQPKQPSAGCVFVNPTPLSAGKLIEDSGLKGETVNKAQISPLHANFIVNLGGAKAEDVQELIKKVKKDVFEKYNLELKEEIVKIGNI